MARVLQIGGGMRSDHAGLPASAQATVITGLHPQRRHPGRANLHVDGAFHCGIAWELVHQLGLRAGTEVSPESLEQIRLADECWKAGNAAASLLAARGRARAELAGRLRRKGFSAAAVEHALQAATRSGLLDDRAFAEAWVRDRLRGRPRGTRALLAELARKGVDPDVARHAVAKGLYDENTDDTSLCMQAAEKWLRTRGARSNPAEPEERRRMERRLAAFLMRRGHGPADIRAALQAVIREGSA